ncbi:MAG: carboxymuconolactone decarboxylase [Chloroflexi bacterium]|nr:MAG: carboxymuconolactone decarboxylase [Chloroflexota bacterium]
MNAQQEQSLTQQQESIVTIAAFAAVGNLPQLNAALQQGLDAGLTISDCREVLVQIYAYAGFPRSLNALGELMKALDERKQRGIQDARGKAPSHAIPQGETLLAAGTANQTQLSGAPVQGALFDFAPAIDEYLKTHLFGDIFERDNLDWKSRELATVGALSAMTGVEPQLQAHIRISRNVGLTPAQLRQLPRVFEAQGEAQAARRLQAALDATLK